MQTAYVAREGARDPSKPVDINAQHGWGCNASNLIELADMLGAPAA